MMFKKNVLEEVQTRDKLPTVVIDASGSFPHQHAASFSFLTTERQLKAESKETSSKKQPAAEHMLYICIMSL